jgi:hypothetical protein
MGPGRDSTRRDLKLNLGINLAWLSLFVVGVVIQHSLFRIVYVGLIVIFCTPQCFRTLRLLRHTPPDPA